MRSLTFIIAFLILSSCSQTQTTKGEVRIDLRGQHLKEIPDSVYQNPEVTYLDLGSSDIKFYPPLSSLVDSSSNYISILPERIGMLKKLKKLVLNTNRLTTLPNSITKLIDLEVLDLSINKDLDIVQQLEKLKQLPKLKVLKIVGVRMTKDEEYTVRSALRSDTKIVLTIPEYMEASN